MKRLFIISFVLIFSVGLFSCQNKPIKTIFESRQKDTATAQTEIKIYRLKEKTINSDFNYPKLDNIDINNKDSITLKQVFEPINGDYIYYKFIATYKGESFCRGQIKYFHDILIIKTDSNNEIHDAYQYTFEWAEPPFQYDVFKSSTKDLILTDNFDISSLKLIRTYYWDEKDKLHKEGGLIKLK